MPTREDIEELYLPTGRVITEEWYSKLTEVLHEFKDEIDGITPVISYGYARGDIIPDLDLALNLGLKTLRFKQIHAGWGYFTYHLQTGNLQAEASSKLILEKRTDDVIEEGRIFYRTDQKLVKVGDGTQARPVGVDRLSLIEIDVDKDWGGHIIKNLGTPVDPADAARLTDLKLSNLSIDTNKNWGGYGISNLSYLDASSFRLAGTEFLGSDGFLKAVKIARYYLDYEENYIASTTDSPVVVIFPDAPHEYFLTLLLMKFWISNPSGSGVTAYWRLVARLDDGSDVTIIEGSVPEGQTREYTIDEHDVILPDGTRRRLYDIGFLGIPSGRAIKQYEFRGRCSATPPVGYYPLIRVRDVNAIQV